jgi:hypothetical protein
VLNILVAAAPADLNVDPVLGEVKAVEGEVKPVLNVVEPLVKDAEKLEKRYDFWLGCCNPKNNDAWKPVGSNTCCNGRGDMATTDGHAAERIAPDIWWFFLVG